MPASSVAFSSATRSASIELDPPVANRAAASSPDFKSMGFIPHSIRQVRSHRGTHGEQRGCSVVLPDRQDWKNGSLAMQIGMVGLGRMGANMTGRLMRGG